MSSHNSVSDVDIYRHFFSRSSYPSCSGADVLLPKALFFSVRLLVLSAGSAVEDWYHKECRSKFGLEGPAAASASMAQRLHICKCSICKYFNCFPAKLHVKKREKREKNWLHNTSVCPWTKSSYNTMLVRVQRSHARTQTLTLAHSHTYPHRHYEPTAQSQSLGLKRTKKYWMNWTATIVLSQKGHFSFMFRSNKTGI